MSCCCGCMQPLKDADPQLYDLIAKEKERQIDCIELIASEVSSLEGCLDCTVAYVELAVSF